MAGKLHKLAALRELAALMAELERHHRQRIARGEDEAAAGRDAAQMALTAVVAFFQDTGIEAKPLVGLLRDLVALSSGASPSRMLRPAAKRHRRPDAPVIEAVKGRLAAIMEFRQATGATRKDAAAWVVRQLPPDVKGRIGAVTAKAVDDWLVKWGGARGAARGSGREGYLAMRALLLEHRPTEAQLKRLIKAHAKELPPLTT